MTAAVRNRRALLTGAQTGGHLYPAVALGRWLADRGIEVVLVASGEAAEADVLKGVPFQVERLRVGKLKGMGWRTRVQGAASLPMGLVRATALVRRLDPGVVVGFGGYTTGPVVLAAALLGVPTAICEENSIPGLTNRLLAGVARRIFVAYDQAGAMLSSRKSLLTGVPVRPAILDVPARTYAGPGRKILVFGGSQGSRFLNRRVPGVLKRLAAGLGGISVLHQAGRGNGDEVRALYADLGLAADVRDYVDDMPAAYAWADFAVSRSGAGTVSEMSAIGLPALFVPFAAATDDHQAANARPLVAAGGALMIREEAFDEVAVAGALIEIVASPDRLAAMAMASRGQGRRDALDVLGAEVAVMLGAGGGSR
jgi:UDP-N-acetylglucosamine--N-acetylmuramyl-(pentapeptide) pyrophosphoryl-undecaprenol N-acetylglucosamine transferase